jgi:hypothetical protein
MVLTNPVLNRLGSRRTLCLATLAVVRCLRVLIAGLPVVVWLGVPRGALLWPVVAALGVSALFGMSAEIARRSWISDLVPVGERGAFFSRRVMISSITGGLVTLAGGWVLSGFFAPPADRLAGISGIAGFGAVMGWCGWAVLLREPEPTMSLPRRRTGLLRSVTLPWRHARFRPLLVVAGSSALATGVCAGFFDMYMLRHLGMEYLWVAAVNVVGEVVAVAGAPLYGAWGDRAGTRRVMTVAMLGKGVFPALWILVAPDTWPLTFAAVLLRTFNSAVEIGWLRFSLNLAPARNQAAFLAMHQALMGGGHAVGALSGGVLARYVGGLGLTILGAPLVPLHVLFGLSAVLRLSCVPLLGFVREPQRVLRRLRESPAGL